MDGEASAGIEHENVPPVWSEERLPGEEPAPAPAPRPRGIAHAALLALLLAGPLALVPLALLLEPDPRGYGTHEQLGLEPCGALRTLGWPCPGCGVTTAMALGARGRVRAAFAVQPFGLAIVLALPWIALWGLVQHARGRDLTREVAALRWRRWAWSALGLLLLSWLHRLAQGP